MVWISPTFPDKVDIFRLTIDGNFEPVTMEPPLTLSVGSSDLAATILGDYAIFTGGGHGEANFKNIVDILKLENDTIVRVDTKLGVSAARWIISEPL